MKKSLLLLMSTIGFFACSPTMKTTSSWTSTDKSITANKTYKTVFISVITSKLEVRTKLENELALAVEKRGLVAIKSIDKFAPVTAGTKPSKEETLELIKKQGADIILTTAIIDKTSETRYVPGTTSMYAPRYGYRGYWGGAYGYSDPGYYTTDKTYFLESNLFDANSDAVIWSAQSEAYNPTSIEKASKKYTELIIAQMEKDGIIKPIQK
jgi:hypothetical protein